MKPHQPSQRLPIPVSILSWRTIANLPDSTADFKLKASWVIPVVVSASVAIGLVVLHSGEAAALGQAVNSFDYRIVFFLNRFARRSWTLDTFFYLIDSNPLVTSPLLMVFWWAWFKPEQGGTQNREYLLLGIINAFLAPCVARTLALTLPYRERPLHNPLVHFQLPYNMNPIRLIGWSSFPSDHAAWWFALATTTLFVSRRLGIFLFAYVFCTLCLARVYLGIHYPTDILAGALIGIGVACLSKVSAIRATLTREPLRWLHRAPGAFYAFLFILTHQMMEGFSSSHDLEAFVRATLTAITRLV